jgi:hypothetical protein
MPAVFNVVDASEGKGGWTEEPCRHDSTRASGWLDDHCLRCGARGYWRQGKRAARLTTHPSGKTLLLLNPEEDG